MRSLTYVAANEVTLLESGIALFPALLAAIDAARYDIFFETYIWSEDKVGNDVREALVRAAQRGVKVHVIVDWFGSGGRVAARLGEALRAAGARYRVFNPWFRRGVSRSHRKIAVIDREVAFVGGINVNDDWFCDYPPHKPLPAPRWDFAVEVRGPLVAHIHHEVVGQWARLGRMNIIRRLGLFREMRRQPRGLGERPMQAAFVVRDNLRHRRTIQRAYLLALGHAKRSVLVANPYFAPGRKLREALAQAARRGVDVRLLIGVGEFRLQDMVAHSFYPKLLAAGVKVYEYRKTQLHAKVAVVDDDWATVGSSNCDGLSLFVNQEANVVVRDRAFAGIVRRHVERGVLDAVPIALEDMRQLGWCRRMSYGLAYRIYKLAMRMFAIGYA
jgi:cardiolipin synthase